MPPNATRKEINHPKNKEKNNDDLTMYRNLTDWIIHPSQKNKNQEEEEVGYIHPSLTILSSSSSSSSEEEEGDDEYTNREITTTSFIPKGQLLIQLPHKYVISGEAMPCYYYYNTPSNEAKREKRRASNWLKCLASLLQSLLHRSSPSFSFYQPYLNSLPAKFDTLTTSWSIQDLQDYLKGTTLGTLALRDCVGDVVKENYRCMVLPYLEQHVNGWGEKEEGYELFLYACACLATRGFHLRQDNDYDKEEEGGGEKKYNGPYLLPFIDLLNHSSSTEKEEEEEESESKCTTLQRDNKTKSFYMMAERDITPNQVVRHSYFSFGNKMDAAQLLQTFGFVENKSMLRASTLPLSSSSPLQNKNENGITPASLHKSDVIKACREVASSTYPQQFCHVMEKRRLARQNIHNDSDEEEEEDEEMPWDIPPPSTLNTRNELLHKLIPQETIPIICLQHALESNQELITACVLQFLPEEVYREFYNEEEGEMATLLDCSVLHDYFLGKLVCQSILKVVDWKWRGYISVEKEEGNKKLRQDGGSNEYGVCKEGEGEEMKPHLYFQDLLKKDQEVLHSLLAQHGAMPQISSSCEKDENTLSDNKRKEENDNSNIDGDQKTNTNSAAISSSSLRRRKMYGLTISIEERYCLLLLRENVLKLIGFLDDVDDCTKIKG